MKKIACGVVGVGYLGRHHARIYSEMPEVEFVGMYDANVETAGKVREEFGGEVFESIEELAERCEAISVVVPTDRHYEVAEVLLKRGVHLLIEKPLCNTLAEAAKIVQLAQEHGCIVQVGHIEHYNPVMGFLEKTVTRPFYVTAERLAPFNPRGTEVGVVLDLMIHDIGVILKLVNSGVKTVEAVGVNVLSRSEDIANARIEFENGAVANLSASRVSFKKVREIRVFEPMKYLSLDFMNQAGHLVKVNGGQLEQEVIPIEKAEPLMLELRSFVECVRKRKEPNVGLGLAKSALEVALEITEQIQEKIKKFGAVR